MIIASDWTETRIMGRSMRIASLAVAFPEIKPMKMRSVTKHPGVCLCVCEPTPEQLAAIRADDRFAIVTE